MSWLWIIQAILIGVLFLGSNYYLWLGMERIPGAERYRKYVPPMLVILTIGFLVWATPRTMVITLDEARAMGGTHHPLLGFFGVMSAKNTVVNLMILTTFLSYILYRRANKSPSASWVRTGMTIQWATFGARRRSSSSSTASTATSSESIVRIGFSRVPGAGGDRRHRARDGDRRADVQGRALHRRDPLGHDRAPLAVRADPPGRDLHLAHGPDGLRPLGHPPALARLRCAARQLGRRGDAGAGLRRQRDHAGDHRVLRAGDVHLLARRAGREGQGRRARATTPHRCSPAAAIGTTPSMQRACRPSRSASSPSR